MLRHPAVDGDVRVLEWRAVRVRKGDLQGLQLSLLQRFNREERGREESRVRRARPEAELACGRNRNAPHHQQVPACEGAERDQNAHQDEPALTPCSRD
jgi:hypothetical protein